MAPLIVLLKGESSETGLWGQTSWNRLATEILRASGEIKPHEEVLEFKADEKWLRYRIGRPKE